MASQLRVKKGMLTRARNTLTATINDLPQLPDNFDQQNPDQLTQLQATLVRHKEAISQAIIIVENKTMELTVLEDQLQLSDDEKTLCDTSVDESVDHVQDAQRTVLKLSSLLAEIAVIGQQQRDTDDEDDDDQQLRPQHQQAAALDQAAQFQQMLLQQAASHAQLLTALTNLTVQKPALPHLQLPKFTGKRWDWDKFYSQFEALVHSRTDVEEIQKFTYLLNCLSDEPKAFIKELQVTPTNYAIALDILQNRYGDNQLLIDELYRNLQALKAASSGPSDQRQLLNSVSALTRQLLAKGEQLDNRLTLNMILSKFSKSVQRKVFEKEIALPAGSAWSLRQLTVTLESTIAQQEKIEQLTNSCNQSAHHSTQEDKKKDDKRNWKSASRNNGPHRRPCRYCKGDHFDNACTVYATASQRQQRLKEMNCCVNCGSSDHPTTACPFGDCSNCPGFKHIRSACPKAIRTSAPQTNRPTPTTTPFAKAPSKPTVSGFGARQGGPSKPVAGGPAHKGPPFKKTANYVSVDNDESVEENKPTPTKGDIFPRHGFHVEGGNGADQSYLMMAKASYVDADGNLATVHMLMDPGSDVSFVRSSFADALHLQTVGAVSMRLKTFASKGAQKKFFEIVDLDILGPNGKKHTLRLPKSEEITGKLLIPRLNHQDCAFLRDNQLQMSLDPDERKLRPDILIGADIFWDLWLNEAPPIRLPSGLRLIPTVFGHVITGSLHFKKRRATCAINVVRRVTRLTSAEPFLCTDTESFDEDDSKTENDRWGPPDPARECCRMATADEIPEEEGDVSNLANALLKGQQQDFVDIPEDQGPERRAKKATDGMAALECTRADNSITWKMITPYSPWQGGFYEHLIKEVKFCRNTTIETAKQDGLLTVLKEIGTSRNDRPLTYQGTAEDPDFLPSDQAAGIRTRNQAVSALHRSTAPRKQAINLFRERYMPSLRELHTLRINNQRGSSTLPRIGAIVLLDEPNQPRHTWPYGRIDSLPTNEGGVAREAIVYVPRTGRTVRRAVNQLIPMELDDNEEINTEQQPAVPTDTATVELDTPRQYNLRTRQPVDYAERDESEFDDFVDRQVNFSTANYARYRPLRNTLPYFLMVLACLIPLAATTSTSRLECIPGGVRLFRGDSTSYQICAESYCITDLLPDTEQEVRFPADVVIRDYKLHWKLQEATRSWTMEDTCPAAPFCSSITCTWCSAMIANPECWPRTAIGVTAVLLYLVVVGFYTLCYVPITTLRVGTACLHATVKGLTWIGSLLCKGANRVRKSRPPLLPIRRIRRRIITAITVLLVLSCLASSSEACQEVDILTSESTVCTKMEDGQEYCHVKATELIKLNAFKRDACFRLSYGNKTVSEYRLTWNNVLLDCVKDPMYYTRNTVYNVLDSKRCPRTGSCKGEKCGNITRQSLVPELEAANHKPGITGCVESCGGPGCDCFYLSSGCLFYRIFLTANDNSTYEVFTCTQWQEMLDMSVSVTSHGETATTRLTLRPNVDFTVFGLKISLSTLTVPPSPILSRKFVTDGSNVALWPLDYQPPLRCVSADNATSMDCEVVEECICTPAEIKMICNCKNRNITADFTSLLNRLPLFYPGISLLAYNGTSVRSSIPTLSTTEIIASINDKVNTTVLAEDYTCTIGNLNIEGCYNCRDGGTATAICRSNAKNTIAEVRCGPDHFAIPCSNEGTATVLRFNFANAQIKLQCSVHCGHKEHHFDITGILKFTGSLRNTAWKAVHGDSNSYSEMQLPDFSHLLDVYLSWMKTCILACICLALALGLTYLYLNTVGLRWTAKLTALPVVLSMFLVRLFFRVLALCMPRYNTIPPKPKTN